MTQTHVSNLMFLLPFAAVLSWELPRLLCTRLLSAHSELIHLQTPPLEETNSSYNNSSSSINKHINYNNNNNNNNK